MILHSFFVQEREEKMNVRKIDINEFRKRKLERSYISIYIVLKPQALFYIIRIRLEVFIHVFSVHLHINS